MNAVSVVKSIFYRKITDVVKIFFYQKKWSGHMGMQSLVPWNSGTWRWS